MGKKMGMTEIFTILKKHLVSIVVTALVFATVSAVYFSVFVDKTYKSSISVYICRKGEINYSDALMSKEISTDAVVILESSDSYISDEVWVPHDYAESMTPFADLEKKGYGKDVIKSMMRYEVVNETGVIRISILGNDKYVTKQIGDALSSSVAAYLQDTIYGIQAKLVSGAKVGVVAGPAIVRNSIIAALIGAILVYSIHAFIFILDNKIRDNENFKNRFEMPFLGEIPKNTGKGLKNGVKGTSNYNNKSTSFRFTETFKSIRTSLFYILPKMKNNIFAVSSPGAKEGKSTVSYHLSISMVEANAKVLVIDADLRNPTISDYFELENKSGLSDILRGSKTFDECVSKDVMKGLDVLTSGPIPENPSELLSGEVVSQLLTYVKDKYDYVIIDTAPVNIVTDSLLLVDKIAGILLVSRYGSTSYTEMKKTIDNITSVNGNILGAVINDAVIFDNSYYYRKYYK